MAGRKGGTKRSAEIDESYNRDMRPIRVVERELTRPDGTTVKVEVPVYPPFELKSRPARKPARPASQRRKPVADAKGRKSPGG